jgi:hypothetical protein
VEGPSYGGGEREDDESEAEDEGAQVLLPDQERRGCAGRRLQVEEVRPEGCQEQPASKVYFVCSYTQVANRNANPDVPFRAQSSGHSYMGIDLLTRRFLLQLKSTDLLLQHLNSYISTQTTLCRTNALTIIEIKLEEDEMCSQESIAHDVVVCASWSHLHCEFVMYSTAIAMQDVRVIMRIH